MPSLSVVRAHNGLINLANKRFLVVGGTSGIGRGIAIKLAHLKASVSVAGRNQTAGNEIVGICKEANPTGTHEFCPIDLTLMKDVKRFAAEFQARHDSLFGLVISAGIMTLDGRTETMEGIDRKLATHYYGRALLIRELIPSLEKAHASLATGNDPSLKDVRVLSVFSAGFGNPVDENDMDLKNTYTIARAAGAAATYNDLMVNALSERHPSLSFIHALPGAVDTGLMHNLPAYIRWPAKLLTPFLTSIDQCGEWMCYNLTAPEFSAKATSPEQEGWYLVGRHSDKMAPKKYHSRENMEKIWSHTEQLWEKALKA
ncbi:FabG domain-containing protein [Phlyctochytrium arcticum]|nr:FabG domain-containing protein [Phlyctochytrium arcticum]